MRMNPVTQLEVIQSVKGEGQRVAGPLEDLDRTDLTMLLQTPGAGIQVVNNFERFFRSNDVLMTDSRTIELWELRQPLMLATILQSKVKKQPQYRQLLSWLHPEAIEKCETFIREVHSPFRNNEAEETKGPETLDGESLLSAMQHAPRLVPAEKEETEEETSDEIELTEIVVPGADTHKLEFEIQVCERLGIDHKPGLDYQRLLDLDEQLLTEQVDSAVDSLIVDDDRAKDYAIVKAMMERIHGRPWNH